MGLLANNFGVFGISGVDTICRATLVVALGGAGTRPAPTCSRTPRIPKEPKFLPLSGQWGQQPVRNGAEVGLIR